MAICFLFDKQIDESGCLCLRLDDQGQIEEPLAHRSLSEIKRIQQEAKTILILSAIHASFHEVELPWLGEKKARVALPFALEESMAQPLETLHFAFDKTYYKNNRYLVIAVDKFYLSGVLSHLETLSLRIDEMTLDWFALSPQEACSSPDSLLVNDEHVKGALRGKAAQFYLEKRSKETHLLVFPDSQALVPQASADVMETPFFLWAAQRIYQHKWINILQGEFQKQSTTRSNQFWYRANAVIGIAIVMSFLFFHVTQWFMLNQALNQVDAQTIKVYHQFFPEAKQVVSPRFRIGQLLGAGASDTPWWALIDRLAKANQRNQVKIEQMRFQSQTLTVTLMAENFAVLDALQQRLQRSGLKVRQTQASSKDEKVAAILELSI